MSLRTAIKMLINTPSTRRVVSAAAIGSFAVTTLSLHVAVSSAKFSATPSVPSQQSPFAESVQAKNLSEESQPRSNTTNVTSKASLDSEASEKSAKTSVSVKVNGKTVDVPENGRVHKVIERDGRRTVVDVQTNQTGNISTFSHTTTTSSVTISTGAGGTSTVVHRSN